MRTRRVVVSNPSGLHARPAAVLVQAAQRFAASIQLEAGAKTADAKSILDVLTLGVEPGTGITIRATGPDEESAVRTLAELVALGLGEPSPAAP